MSHRKGSALSGAFENWGLSLELYRGVELSHVPFYCKLKDLSHIKAVSRNTVGCFQCAGNPKDSHGVQKTSSLPSGGVGL